MSDRVIDTHNTLELSKENPNKGIGDLLLSLNNIFAQHSYTPIYTCEQFESYEIFFDKFSQEICHLLELEKFDIILEALNLIEEYCTKTKTPQDQKNLIL